MARPNHIFRKIRKGSQAEKLVEALIARPQKSESRTIGTVQALCDSRMGIRTKCTGCGADHFYSGSEMIEVFLAETELKDIRPGCLSCGAKSVNVLPESLS
jgi:hypothetical protein